MSKLPFAERQVEASGGYYDSHGKPYPPQLLSLLAMDKPATPTKDAIRAKVKSFWAIAQSNRWRIKKKFFIRGQYHSGKWREKKILYRSEPNVDPESTTETHASARSFFVDSERSAVPFFFRTGKRLTKGNPWSWPWLQTDSSFGHSCKSNILTIYIQSKHRRFHEYQRKECVEDQYRTDSFDYETDGTATGASPEPYEN